MIKPISVDERLPEENTQVLAYNAHVSYKAWRIMSYCKRGWIDDESTPWDIIFVTHWLPMLPAPDSAAWRECETGEGDDE